MSKYSELSVLFDIVLAGIIGVVASVAKPFKPEGEVVDHLGLA